MGSTKLRNWVSGVRIPPGAPPHVPPAILTGRWTQSANHERANLRETIKITVDVHHAHAMMERRLGNQEVRDRRAVPHAVVMCEVSLQMECSIEDIHGRRDDLEIPVQIVLEQVIVTRRAGRVQLFELPNRTHEQESCQRREFFPDPWIRRSRCRTFVENPTG